MKITRDVISDLLPVYQSGEASQDTRELVETFLSGDPEFARIVHAQPGSLLPENQAILPQGIEMETLQKTKTLLKKRAYFLAFAIFFTLFSFAFSFNAGGVRWIWAETPILAAVFLGGGIVLWILYARSMGKLKGSDL